MRQCDRFFLRLERILSAVLSRYFFHRHLDEEETILLVVQKHWLLGLRALWLPTLVFLAVWSVPLFFRITNVVYGAAIAALAVAIWWIRNFLDYYLDAWLVTNKGVIDLAWHGWFHRSSTRVLYSDVEGVGYEIKGIAGTLLNFGEMQLEKISTGTAITMPFVHTPKRVEATILEAMEAYVLKKNLRDATTVKTILAEIVASTLQAKTAKKK